MADKKLPKFCDWQEEVSDSKNYACCADLHTGRAFDCRYKASEIYTEKETGKKRIARRGKDGKIIAICEDFNALG